MTSSNDTLSQFKVAAATRQLLSADIPFPAAINRAAGEQSSRRCLILVLWPEPPTEGQRDPWPADAWAVLIQVAAPEGEKPGRWEIAHVSPGEAVDAWTVEGGPVPTVTWSAPHEVAERGVEAAEATALACRFGLRCQFRYRKVSGGEEAELRAGVPFGVARDQVFTRDARRNDAVRGFAVGGMRSLGLDADVRAPRWDGSQYVAGE